MTDSNSPGVKPGRPRGRQPKRGSKLIFISKTWRNHDERFRKLVVCFWSESSPGVETYLCSSTCSTSCLGTLVEYSVTWSSGGAAEQNRTELDIRTADPGKIPRGYFNSVLIFSGAVFLTRVTSAVTDSCFLERKTFTLKGHTHYRCFGQFILTVLQFDCSIDQRRQCFLSSLFACLYKSRRLYLLKCSDSICFGCFLSSDVVPRRVSDRNAPDCLQDCTDYTLRESST